MTPSALFKQMAFANPKRALNLKYPQTFSHTVVCLVG